MNERAEYILDRQEEEDLAATRSEEELRRKIGREFSNAAAVLGCLAARGLSPCAFFTAKVIPAAWPVLPVRRAEGFDIRKHTASQRPYLHGHDFYELIYVRRGTCAQRLRKDGEGGLRELVLHEGQAALLSPAAVHLLHRPSDGDVVLKLVLPRALYEKTGGGLFVPSPCAVLNVPPAAEHLFCRLLEENHARRAHFARAVEGYLSLLFVALRRGAETDGAERDEAFFRRLTDYFAAAGAQASLRGFASLTGYSAGYAGRLVLQKTGESFSPLLAADRLRRAAALLESGDLSVEAVALTVGYANPSGLYKQFCAAYGMPPAAYRKLFR